LLQVHHWLADPDVKSPQCTGHWFECFDICPSGNKSQLVEGRSSCRCPICSFNWESGTKLWPFMHESVPCQNCWSVRLLHGNLHNSWADTTRWCQPPPLVWPTRQHLPPDEPPIELSSFSAVSMRGRMVTTSPRETVTIHSTFFIF
jgi:hypothetical protein